MKRRSVPGEGEALNMDIYILLSILVSALFFFTNFFSWGYNLALSLLILFLFLLRLAPAWRLGFLKNVAAISTASALFGVASLLVPLVRSEALLVLTVFLHELIFLILSFRFTGLVKAFQVLTSGAILACGLLVSLGLEQGMGTGGDLVTVRLYISIGINIFLVAAALFFTYSNLKKHWKLSTILSPLIILISGGLLLFYFATYSDETTNRLFTIIAYYFIVCSMLYSVLMWISFIFGADGRETPPIRFSPGEKRKYEEEKRRSQWVRLRRRIAEEKEK